MYEFLCEEILVKKHKCTYYLVGKLWYQFCGNIARFHGTHILSFFLGTINCENAMFYINEVFYINMYFATEAAASEW